MGLYLRVIVDSKCPKCGMPVKEWQSKNIKDKLGYYLETMQDIKFKDVFEGEMHAICCLCDSYIKCDIKDGQIVKTKYFKVGEEIV